MTRRTVLILASAAIASFAINGALKILNVSLSPTGSTLRSLIFGTTVLQIGLLVALVLHLLAQASTQKFAESSKTLLLAAGIYLIAGFVGNSVAAAVTPSVQVQGFERFAAENNMLVEAIEQYEADNGAPPATLAALYPAYLAEPVAALDESKDVGLQLSLPYESINANDARRVAYSYDFPNDAAPEQWELAVNIYLGSFQSVRFVYNDAQAYEADYSRAGDWAFKGGD